MKSLIIAEKPSVARDIARVLGCNRKLSGALEGSKYVVTWALGHLVTLADPDKYHPKYKTWNMDDLPMIPKDWELVVIPQTAKQYNAVKSQIYRKDIADIIIATDAGREGELVARLILAKAKANKPLKRLWISSVTDKAIKEGFAHLRPGKDYENLYHAATSRAKADWLVGINATRALTCKYNASLSCGRVQTPTLAMIYEREQLIRNFKPEEFYKLDCHSDKILFSFRDKKSGSYHTFNKDFLTTLANQLKNKALKVEAISQNRKKVYAPGLYDLTELQRDANKRFGFSAKETLNIAQKLYEHHKVLTYPRTDSRYLSKDIIPTLKDRLLASATGVYRSSITVLIKEGLKTNASFINDAKVSDHHALIPTEEAPDFAAMSNEEKKIYDLVIRRFIAVFYPPYEYEQTTIVASALNAEFVAKGKRLLSLGWKAAYGDSFTNEEENSEDLKEQNLPALSKGTVLKILKTNLTTGKSKAPAKFTEATLLSAMENPGKYAKDTDKKTNQTLNETGGLGTVATRADIIEKLFSSFLIEKNGNSISTTSKGRQLLSLVPTDLKSPRLTALWENDLTNIAKGSYQEGPFIHKIEGYTKDIIKQIKTEDGNFKHDNITNSKCPNCGKRMLLVKGKNARLLVCQDRECGYKETIAKITNARCPNCHKKMELIKKNDIETFVCSCGHKEKLEAFQKRRAKEGAGVSKRDVNNYLKKQKKEQVGTSFSDLLQNIDLK